MDATVTAALIAAPISVLAAAAAFAAGRLQARGAQYGPVDAVRRQHQRDAYATLLAEFNRFAEATAPHRAALEVRSSLTPFEVEARRLNVEHIMSYSYTSISEAHAAVLLEGPADVSQAANAALESVQRLIGLAALARTLEHEPENRSVMDLLTTISPEVGGREFTPPSENLASVHGQLRADINAYLSVTHKALTQRPR
ncbi:hypothetical protein QJ054_32880 [Streptomyces sp. AN-3]|uniref:hypothetical protein n=1 Tax=Streptomyces sp. AN-3 TaxID=3044177 RepID=UPI00249C7159|nr:hypothetical protein [Streptomyces sp. AN-3]MDI3101841.1 hypothetical protein [Streptomyces sp. AN-3]